MFQIVIAVLGIIASALFVGYLAYAIDRAPLWIIIIGTYVLMIREFIVEFRGGNGNRGNRGGPRA